MRESFEHLEQRSTGLPEFRVAGDTLDLERSLGGFAVALTAQEAVARVGDGLADTVSMLVGGPPLQHSAGHRNRRDFSQPVPPEAWQLPTPDHYMLAA